MKKPYVIADIGVNFYDTANAENITPMEAARKYIYSAKQVGIDAVKFQAYKADTIVIKNSPAYWDTKKEPTKTQHLLFKKHDGFNIEDYRQLCYYSKEIGIDFMCTPFDYASVDFLNEMIEIYKISSSDISNIPFIKYIAQKKKPVYLSVGASYISEIDEAVRILKSAGCPQICLMHCVLSYPCENKNANLNIIKTLKNTFPDELIGYSDHTLPDKAMAILTTAYLFGAQVIEKHFTLDKSLTGNDHYHAGDPEDFELAIQNFKLISTISGQEQKTVLPCEQISRKEARRSLVTTRKVKKGDILKANDLIAKRPGYGISPQYLDILIGRSVNQDIEEDTILTWEMT